MEEHRQHLPPPGSMPVVMNMSMRNSAVAKILQQCQLKVRETDSIPANIFIFPMSSLAFLRLPLANATSIWPPKMPIEICDTIIEWIKKALEVHRRCVFLGLAGLHDSLENAVWTSLQQRFLFTNLQMIPVHNDQECVETMLTMAQGLTKIAITNSQKDISDVIGRRLAVSYLDQVCQDLGLSEHYRFVLEEGIGSMSRLANATKEELLDCSLDNATADTIIKYFNDN